MAAPTASTPQAPPLKSDKRVSIPRQNMKLAEEVRREFWLKAPPEATKDSPRYPEFWAGVCDQLSRHDVVYLIADDESWQLECIVERVTHAGADVSIAKNISRQGIVQSVTILSPEYHSEFRAGMGWCVVRTKDSFPVVKGGAHESTAIMEWQRQQPRPVA